MVRSNIVTHRAQTGKRRTRHWRIYGLVFLILCAAGVITFRLYTLQVKAHEAYRLIAQGQHQVLTEISPRRGEVFLKDRNSLYPLAVNKELKLIYAVPKEIENPEETARILADLLELEQQDLQGKLSESQAGYRVLKHKVPGENWKRIKELSLWGIYASPEPVRFYPGGELAASTIGFYGYGPDGETLKGRYGIEAAWDEKLRGKEGEVQHERDAGGRWISIGKREVMEAEDGSDLVLTIESTVQYEVERMLRRAMAKHGADKGLVIVVEVPTGKIIALANQPSFNPNNYSEVKPDKYWVFRSSAASDTYESGSVFKTITMAAGIDLGKITPETTYYDSGAVTEAGYTIQNSDFKAHGKQNMFYVLEESLNTGAIFVQRQIGNSLFRDYIKRFGFGQLTGLGLPGEESGNIANLEEINRNINFFTASFGQGIAMTPLQLAMAYAALGNAGELMKPYIVEKIKQPGGKEIEIQPQAIRRVVSEETAATMTQMLESVVINGHGKRAFVPGYSVAGKTGTAQVASSETKGYEEGLTIGSFAGYGPAENPKFAILVKMDNPKDVQWAESSAAPLFGEVMKLLLDYYAVEPTKTIHDEDIERFDMYHKAYWDIDLSEGGKDKDNEKEGGEKKEEAQIPETTSQ